MKSLEKYGSFTIKEGDGAFYGPKIDVQIRDALNRPFQCGKLSHISL
jgi:threonyl-tRNA synthetase